MSQTELALTPDDPETKTWSSPPWIFADPVSAGKIVASVNTLRRPHNNITDAEVESASLDGVTKYLIRRLNSGWIQYLCEDSQFRGKERKKREAERVGEGD